MSHMAYQLNHVIEADYDWEIMFTRHGALLADLPDLTDTQPIPLPCGEKDWGYECRTEGKAQGIHNALWEISGGFQVEVIWVNRGDSHHTYYPHRLIWPHEVIKELKHQSGVLMDIEKEGFEAVNEWLNDPSIAFKLGFYIRADTKKEFAKAMQFFGNDYYPQMKEAWDEICKRNSLSTFEWGDGSVEAWGEKWDLKTFTTIDGTEVRGIVQFLKRVVAVWLNEMAVWYLKLFKGGNVLTTNDEGKVYIMGLANVHVPSFSPIKWQESDDWELWGIVNHGTIFGYSTKMKLPFPRPTVKGALI
jgi:hypothetical protein